MRDGGTGRMRNGDTISTISNPSLQVSTTRKSNLWDDVPNNQQCGLYDNNTLNNQQGVLYEISVPGDQQAGVNDISARNISARNESSAMKEACPVSRNLALT